MRARKSFMSDKFVITSRKNPRTGRMTFFAVATAPSGVQAFRIVSKTLAKKNNKVLVR